MDVFIGNPLRNDRA
ncbi:hypothetical protein D043_4062A, partial [Vibrio parahaemolyticus EKP-021]